MKRNLSQDMIEEALNAAENITIYNYHVDKMRLDFQLIHRFPFLFSKIDQRKSQIVRLIDRLDLSIEEKIECIRREFVLWGPCYVIGDNNFPYFGMDLSDVKRVIGAFESRSFEVWICHPTFAWCMETRTDSSVALHASPYNVITSLIAARGRDPT